MSNEWKGPLSKGKCLHGTSMAEHCDGCEPRTGYLSPDYSKGFEDGQAALRPWEAAALLALPRFSYGPTEDDFGVERSLGFVPDPAGPIVRFADVVTALALEATRAASWGIPHGRNEMPRPMESEPLEDQSDVRAMIDAAFGEGTKDILMNGTTNRYLSDMIEEVIACRIAKERASSPVSAPHPKEK